MKQLPFIILLVSITFCSRGKDKTDSVQTKHKCNNSFAVRGQFLPWIFLFTGVRAAVGAEYGFNKKYAVGLQAEYGYLSFPNDSGEHIGARMNQIYRSGLLTLKGIFVQPSTWLHLRGMAPLISILKKATELILSPIISRNIRQVRWWGSSGREVVGYCSI